MKQREKIAIAFVAGFAAVYVLKYGIFGLEAWDKFLHPARLAASWRSLGCLLSQLAAGNALRWGQDQLHRETLR